MRSLGGGENARGPPGRGMRRGFCGLCQHLGMALNSARLASWSASNVVGGESAPPRESERDTERERARARALANERGSERELAGGHESLLGLPNLLKSFF
jgi:hypothetical protein